MREMTTNSRLDAEARDRRPALSPRDLRPWLSAAHRALAEPHAARATPIGSSLITAQEWFGALALLWGTEVIAASTAVERHIDRTREEWRAGIARRFELVPRVTAPRHLDRAATRR